MAKVRGPLLSLSAQGQIAHSIVMASWRGVAYARQYVVPTNRQTVAQQLTRNTFKGLDYQFKRSLSLAQAPWAAAAKGRPLTDRNAYMSANIPPLRGEADMSAFVASPGVSGGLPGANFAAAGGVGAGEIDLSIDVGQNPVDWEQPSVTFCAFLDRDPSTLMTDFVVEATEPGAGAVYVPPQTISHTFSGLTSGATYACCAFLLWTRADGITAYGPSETALVAAT